MTSTSNVIIPVKGLRCGKSRLSDSMSDAERFDLNCYLADRTVRIVATLEDIVEITVVSPDANVREIADRHGAKFILQTSRGLNAGLDEAARQVPDRRTVYLAADLPELEPDDIRTHISAQGIGISPDRKREGTNALSVPTPRKIEFRFGPKSYDTHCALARAAGFPASTIDRAGIAFDVDTKSDLACMKGWP